MRRRCWLLGVGAVALYCAVVSAQETPPEEAFTDSPTPAAPETVVSAEDPANEAVEPSITSIEPTPFYRRWLESFLDLTRRPEPYTRDKLKFVLGTSLGYDDNVLYSSTNPISSPTYGVNGAIDYNFGSKRLKIESKLIGSINYYKNRPGGNQDQTYGLTLALDYQWQPRVSISLNTYTAYLSQPSPQLIGGSYLFTGSYFYTDTSLAINYVLRPRFSIGLGYGVNGFHYDDETINQGSGFYQQNFSLSGNWLLTPRTTLVLQYRYNPVTYYESGVGSTGQFLLIGINQTLSPRLKCSLLFGSEYRSLENPAPDSPASYFGPYAEGSLEYQFGPHSVLLGTMRLGTEPSGTAGVTVRQSFRMGLSASHTLGKRLTLSAGVGYEKDHYDQPGVIADFTQDIYSLSLSARYEFAIATAVVLRDDYLMLSSSTENSSYSRNFASVGLEVTF